MGLTKEVDHHDLVKLLSTNICISCNLSHADLAYSHLYGADISESKLSDAVLINSTLTNANLKDADLTNANLSGADLKGVNFMGATLDGTNFKNADLSGAIILREQLLQSRWRHAMGIDTSLLLDADLFDIVVMHLKSNQLAAAEQYLSLLLTRTNDDPSLFVLRASINFKSGDINSALNDLELASNMFAHRGDSEGAMAVEEVINSYDIHSANLQNNAYGSGHGIKMLNAVKSIVPLVLPLTSKFLLPLSLL